MIEEESLFFFFCARFGKLEMCATVWPENHKRPLQRLTRTWESNIKMDFTKIFCEDVDNIQVAHDRVQCLTSVNT